nr:NAD(P)-binding Rossmann-fold superfamily protein [Tanacetum cinerariifolium]
MLSVETIDRLNAYHCFDSSLVRGSSCPNFLSLPAEPGALVTTEEKLPPNIFLTLGQCVVQTPSKNGSDCAHLKPAVEGTLRVLQAARDAGVKRVVLTSSFGAVGFSHTDRATETTEADWTDPNLKGMSTYEKSKGLAERAAWDFIKKEGGTLELSTINLVAILGPSLGRHTSGSFDIIRHLIDGSLKAVPNIPLNVVDVRDVADLHVRAMTTPAANGPRFIASADGQISMPEIAQLLKQKMPQIAEKVATKTVPDWVVRFASLFNPQAKTGAMFLKVNRRVSNAKAKQVLGWKPLATNEQAILSAAESLVNPAQADQVLGKSHQYLYHIVVVPAGLLATRPQTASARLSLLQEVEGQLTQCSEAARSYSVTAARFVFSKHYVEYPVQTIFNGPRQHPNAPPDPAPVPTVTGVIRRAIGGPPVKTSHLAIGLDNAVPKASSVIMVLAKHRLLSKSGIAVSSYPLRATTTYPRLRSCWVAKALITCKGAWARPQSKERRTILPSTATTSRGKGGAVVATHWRKHCSSACGSTSENTRQTCHARECHGEKRSRQPGADLMLRRVLSGVQGFDYCLIDTSPYLGPLTDAALTAADAVFIPTEPEAYGVDGLIELIVRCNQ